jgi:hypothetical protein
MACKSDAGAQTETDAASTADTEGMASGEESSSTTTGDPLAACGQIIYLNFEGPTLAQWDKPDSAPENRVQSSSMAREYEPYTGGDNPEILAIVQGHFAPFDVCVVDERPGGYDYTMVVISDTDPGMGLSALTVQDCGNENPNNVVAVFALDWAVSARAVANVVGANLGATFGLDQHTTDSTDLACFNPTSGLCGDYDDQRSFVDKCIDLSGTNLCFEQHAVFCGGGEQNSFQELEDLLGLAPM